MDESTGKAACSRHVEAVRRRGRVRLCSRPFRAARRPGARTLPKSLMLVNPEWRKAKTVYTCTECGGQSPSGRASARTATAWNTLVETIAAPPQKRFQTRRGKTSQVRPLASVEARHTPRFPTGRRGVRPRAGRRARPGRRDPAGRRSGHRQVDAAAAGDGRDRRREEGALRHRRGIGRAGRASRAAARASSMRRCRCWPRSSSRRSSPRSRREAPEVVVIDSIQTAYTEALTSAPGSVAQVRECAAQLTRLAKQRGIVVVFVGHVTKEGAIAGPRVLEHIVDTVLYFEGDPHSSFRLVRAIKNRFGAANELGVFAMTERGLEGRRQSVGAVPVAARARGPRLGDRRDAGGLAPAAGRDPGAGRPGAGRDAAAAVGRPRPAAARAAAGGSALATAASRPPATTSSSMPSAACASTSPRPTSRSCSLSIRRWGAGRCRRRRSFRRSRAGGRDPSGAARPGADPRGGQARVHHGADSDREQAEARDGRREDRLRRPGRRGAGGRARGIRRMTTAAGPGCHPPRASEFPRVAGSTADRRRSSDRGRPVARRAASRFRRIMEDGQRPVRLSRRQARRMGERPRALRRPHRAGDYRRRLGGACSKMRWTQLTDFHVGSNPGSAHTPWLAVPTSADLWAVPDGDVARLSWCAPAATRSARGLPSATSSSPSAVCRWGLPLRCASPRPRMPRDRGRSRMGTAVARDRPARGRHAHIRAASARRSGAHGRRCPRSGVSTGPPTPVSWSRLPENVGVIRINNSLGEMATVAVFDAALAELRDTRALILDLRDTPSGGSSAVALGVMVVLVAARTPYHSRHRIAHYGEPDIERNWQEEVAPRWTVHLSCPAHRAGRSLDGQHGGGHGLSDSDGHVSRHGDRHDDGPAGRRDRGIHAAADRDAHRAADGRALPCPTGRRVTAGCRPSSLRPSRFPPEPIRRSIALARCSDKSRSRALEAHDPPAKETIHECADCGRAQRPPSCVRHDTTPATPMLQVNVVGYGAPVQIGSARLDW